MKDQEQFKMKDDIEFIFINIIKKIGIDIPNNWEDIVQFIYEDVLDTADKDNWTSEDVSIGFRRYLETKTK